MRLTVMGTGYVGLVASVCLAELGHEVIALDIDEERVDRLQSGELPLYEPGLQERFDRDTVQTKLEFTHEWEPVLRDPDVVMIAVGTPKREDGSCDISYVLGAARMIGRALREDTVVATKSTVPVGTGQLVGQHVNEHLLERYSEDEVPRVDVASNPEFLREGSAVQDFLHPDRIVIGSESDRALERLSTLYDPIEAPVLTTGLRTAEMIKYAANAMLATKISFINEIANVCELVGADVQQVADAVGMDDRINRQFLNAGIGYGGSCFPKDTEALVQIAGQGGYHSQILSAVMNVNQQQRVRFARRVIRNLPDSPDPRVAVLGLSFKPNTDDMREAPSVDIVQELQSSGIGVTAYDPEAMENARQKLSGIEWAPGPLEAVEERDALLLLTEWDEFVSLDFERVFELMKHPVIFDGRNVLPMDELVSMGFQYYGVGRGVDRLDNIVSNKHLVGSSSTDRLS